MEVKIRIGNLELRKASYLGKEPKVPAYHINKWVPNEHYKQQRKYIKDGDFYKPKNSEFQYRIHKNCFKNPESCYSIATFCYDEKEEYYEFSYIGNRPLSLNDEEFNNFQKLIKIGFTILNGDLCSNF